MNKIAVSRIRQFVPIDLDKENYMLYLLKQGYQLDLLTLQEVEKCQYEVILLVKQLIKKYTGGASSSVKVELAQNFLSSILFTIDAWLLQINDSAESMELIKCGNIVNLYLQGMDHLNQYFDDVRSLFSETIQNQLEINNTAYQLTINQALPDFLEQYDLIYHAHSNMADIDYPLLFDDMDTQGIYYIKQYLEILRIETDFCRHFSAKQLNNLLSNYGRVYRINHREALINMFEITLCNCLFSILVNESSQDLSLSKSQVDKLQIRLCNMEERDLNKLVLAAMEQIISEFAITSTLLKSYMYKYINMLLPRLKTALEHGHLSNIAIIDSKKNSGPDIVLDLGQRMNDDEFRSLVEDILNCKFSKQRIDLIFNSVHSLGDFIDLLEADCLFQNDWPLVFKRLGDMELSILGRIIYIDQIRSDPHGFSILQAGQIDSHSIWQVNYDQFLKKLSKKRLQSINKLLHSSIQSQYLSE